MINIEGLYELVKQGNEFNKEKFDNITELINVQNTHTRAKIEAIEHSIKQDISEIKKNQITANGRITNSENEVKTIKWIKKHPLVCAGIFVLVTFLANIILTVFSLRELIEFAF